jgi:hypothetical protein
MTDGLVNWLVHAPVVSWGKCVAWRTSMSVVALIPKGEVLSTIKLYFDAAPRWVVDACPPPRHDSPTCQSALHCYAACL